MIVTEEDFEDAVTAAQDEYSYLIITGYWIHLAFKMEYVMSIRARNKTRRAAKR